MNFKLFKWLVPALGLALVISACGNKEKKLKLAFVTNNSATFWIIARAGCTEAEQTLGNVTVDFRIPAKVDAAAQQQILNDLVADGVDGIAVSPIAPDHQTEFLNKIAAKTLLICHDSDAPDSKRVCYIGTDNAAAGVEAGKLIKEAIPGGGKIMMFVGNMDAENSKQRFAGIKKELEGSNVQIVDVRTDGADVVRAQQNAADSLVAYPDLVCLVGLYDYNGPAILNAVRHVGKNGKVKIVCFDEKAETLEGVAAGDIYGTVVQQPYEFGKQAITKMAQHLTGDTNALAGGKQIIPTQNLRKADIAAFQEKMKKLTGK